MNKNIHFIFIGLWAVLTLVGCKKTSPAEEESIWPQPFDIEPIELTMSSNRCPPEIDEYIDQLRCIELQADAVAIDMILSTVFMPRMRCRPEGTLGEAFGGYEKIQQLRLETQLISVPASCHALHDAFLDALDKSARLYIGIDKTSHKKVRRELAKAQAAVKKYREMASALQSLPEYIKPDPVPPDVDEYVMQTKLRGTEPLGVLPDKVDRYNELVEAGVPDDDPEMAEMLETMWTTNPSVPWWEETSFYIPERFIGTGDNEFTDHDDVAYLWILLGGEYHSFLYEAFTSWRGGMQSSCFGVSNFSEIPNRDYNEVRFIAVKTIQKHLREHPDDHWARIQKALLLGLFNIQRGGMFGVVECSYVDHLYKSLNSPETNRPAEKEVSP